MQNTSDEVINVLQQVHHCFICDAALPSPNNADQHYASIRHNKKVKALYENPTEKLLKSNSTEVINKLQIVAKAQVEVPQKKPYCQICNIHIDDNLINQHYQEIEHKRKEELFCKTCTTLASSREQIWRHMHGMAHNKKLREMGLPSNDGQYGPFDLTLPLSLKKIMLPEVCQLCNARFPTMKHASDHYKSQKHKSSVLKVQKEDEIADGNTNKSLPEKTVNVVIETSKPLLKVVDTHCFVCKMDVNVGVETENHRSSFPHTELVKLKADMISKGIKEEYFVREDETILCTLCNVKMATVLDASEHFIEANHCLKFHNWFKKLGPNKNLAESDTKWFYCKTCDKPLDCTTESARHYQSISHKKKRKRYCFHCNVSNRTQELLEIHYTTALHVENARKAGTEEIKNNIPTVQWWKIDIDNQNLDRDVKADKADDHLNTDLKNKNNQPDDPLALPDSKNNTSENNKRLKGQVFIEFEKLIGTLYLSKKVPLDVALNYLQKCNKEVQLMKKTYERKEPQEKPDYSSGSSNGFQEEPKNDSDEKNNSLNDQKIYSEDDYYSFNSDTLVSNEAQTVYDLIDFSEAPENNTVGNIIQKEAQSRLNVTDICDKFKLAKCNGDEGLYPVDKRKESNNNHASDKTESNERTTYLPSGNLTNFETMLEEISLLKSRLEEEDPNIESPEKNVLTEIERLINLINCDDIPSDVMLRYLQNFNAELDIRYYGESVTARGLGDERNEADDGYKTKQAQEVLYRYSEEDLVSLRTADTFTSLDAQLRIRINDARIWNSRCNNLDLD